MRLEDVTAGATVSSREELRLVYQASLENYQEVHFHVEESLIDDAPARPN